MMGSSISHFLGKTSYIVFLLNVVLTPSPPLYIVYIKFEIRSFDTLPPTMSNNCPNRLFTIRYSQAILRFKNVIPGGSCALIGRMKLRFLSERCIILM